MLDCKLIQLDDFYAQWECAVARLVINLNCQKVKYEVILQTRGLIQHHDSSKHLK